MLNGKEIIIDNILYEKIDYIDKNSFTFIHVYKSYDDLTVNTPSHWHNGIEIIIPLTGSFIVSANNCQSIIKKGQLCVINSREIHRTDVFEKEGDFYDGYVIQISKQYLENTFPNILDLQFKNLQEIYPCFQLCKFIFLEYENCKDNSDYSILMHLINTLISYLIKYGKYTKRILNEDNIPSNKLEIITYIMNYIDKNYKTDINIYTLSQKMNFSYGYLAKIFKEGTSISIKEYIKKVRLQKSLDDLIHTNVPIIDIAYNNGYPNVKSFNNDFKKHYRSTPNEFRKVMRK